MIAPGRADAPQADAPGVGRMAGARWPSLLELMSLKNLRRFVPETLGLLLAVVLVRGMLDASPPGASGPHLAFWIPVLLMASQYGIMGGLFAALSTSLLVLATELPPQSAAQDFYDYASFAAAQPCAWFTAALVLGGLRTLHMHKQAQLQDQLADARAAAEELATRLAGSVRELALTELRIATDTATTAVLIDALARVDLSSGQALLASFANIVRHGAGAESFAVFLRDGTGAIARFGLEKGAPIPDAVLSLMPPPPPAALGREDPGVATIQGAAAGLPIWLPIRVSDAAEPVGCLVCTGVAPAQTPAAAARRLREMCCLLAKLLPPDAVPAAAPRLAAA